MVLIFAAVLAILGFFLLRNSRQQNRQNQTSFNQLQAHFVARAGLEHALLKVKYLPRELYDAACLAQGRNPLYDFSKGIDGISPQNPGPIFLYRDQSGLKPQGFLTPNFEKQFPQARLWLDSYREDLVSGKRIGSENLNFAMSFSNLPDRIKAVTKEPFTGSYEVTAIDLTANTVAETEKQVANNQAIVELTVEATVKNARGESWTQSIKRTVRVSRDVRK